MPRRSRSVIPAFLVIVLVSMVAAADRPAPDPAPEFHRQRSEAAPDSRRARDLAEVFRRRIPRPAEAAEGSVTAVADSPAPAPVTDAVAEGRVEVEVEAAVVPPLWLGEASAGGRAAAAGEVTEARDMIAALALWQGLTAALGDGTIGAEDRSQGLAQGLEDPGAWRWGRRCGQEAAGEDAAELAVAEVESRFRDLSRLPSPDVRAEPPPWSGCRPPLEDPDVRSLVIENPGRWQASVEGIAAVDRRGLDGFVALAEADLPVPAWDVDEALARWWLGEGAAPCRGLPFSLRRQAEEVFRQAFLDTAAGAGEDLERLWDGWFVTGWELGVELAAELSYRRGVVEGFSRAAEEAAELAYGESFPVHFRQTFDETFTAWASSIKAEVAWLEIASVGGGGVVRAGEVLELELEVVNYGGLGGAVEVRLEGEELDGAGSATVELAARSRERLPTIRARVKGDIEGRRASVLDVLVGDSRRGLSLVVQGG